MIELPDFAPDKELTPEELAGVLEFIKELEKEPLPADFNPDAALADLLRDFEA